MNTTRPSRASPRARARGEALEARVVFMGPNHFAGGRPVTNHRLFLVELFLRKQAVADDNHGRPPRPNALLPPQPGAGALPVGRDVRAANHAVALRAPETNPVARTLA